MRKPSFVYVTYIQTMPENVWDALINPELVSRRAFACHLRDRAVHGFRAADCHTKNWGELRSISQGWPAILSSMKSLLETGKPLSMTTRR
jgi:hypothetical protein